MKTRIRFALLLTAILTVAAFVCQAQPQSQIPPKPFVGKAISVSDGDTVTVLYQGKKLIVRLETIDAPEMTQPFGPQAKKALEEKVMGKEVKVVWKSKDKYSRIRGEVYLEDRRLCLEMVAEGFAWHYLKYSKDPQLAKAEFIAREAKRGLWADAKAVPPWEFRVRKGFDEEIEPAKVVVFVTKKGKSYHLENCSSLAKSQIKISLADAVQRYQPCSRCKPPVPTSGPNK